MSKKVRIISAPKDALRSRKTTVPGRQPPPERETGELLTKSSRQKPGWGYRNPEHKRPLKQSEKDLNFEQRRQKRLERQTALLDLADINTAHVQAVMAQKMSSYEDLTSRGNSDKKVKVSARHPSDPQSNAPSKRGRSPSKTQALDRGQGGHRVPLERSPMRQQNKESSRSPTASPAVSPSRNPVRTRQPSPPIPAIKRRLESVLEDYSYHDDHRHQTGGADSMRGATDRYRDVAPVVGSATEVQFVPFVRSSNVLNPAHAASPMPVSREPTEMVKARIGHQMELNPAKYGQPMENYSSTNGRIQNKAILRIAFDSNKMHSLNENCV